jgi:hypothetical protein
VKFSKKKFVLKKQEFVKRAHNIIDFYPNL